MKNGILNVIAIDPSKSRTGIYISQPGQSLSVRNKPTETQEGAVKNVFLYFQHLLSEKDIDLGVMEAYSINMKRPSGILATPEIVGVIRLAFVIHGIPLVNVPAMTWKAMTIGMVKKQKKASAAYLDMVKLKYGKDFQNTDEADAFMIYEAVRIMFGGGTRLTTAAQIVKDNISDAIERIRHGKKEM